MKLIRNSFAVSVAFATLAVAACSSQPSSTGSASNAGNNGGQTGSISNDGVGQVRMNLDIAPGVTLTSISYTISNGTNTYTGTDPIGDAQSLEFVAGGIQAGGGYTVTLTGTDSNGDTCLGTSSVFTVIAGAVAQATLGVLCTAPSDAAVATTVDGGSVAVTGTVTYVNGQAVTCPGISSFSIFPAEINLSQTAGLTLASVGPAASILWSVSPAGGGTFGSATSANTTFACAPSTTGNTTVTITATVALPDSGACTGVQFTTMSAPIDCENGVTGGLDASTTPDTSTGTPDTGTGTPDTGAPDVSTGPTPGGPCTQLVAGVPANAAGSTTCTKCTGTLLNDGVCSATEALIVSRDIAQGNVTAAGQLLPGTGSCYSCLNANSCLDDNQMDTGLECSDTSDLAGSPAGSGVTQCLNTLSCILNTDCQGAGGIAGTSAVPAQENINLCYCGGNNAGSACQTAGANTNGKCVAQEAAGFGFAFSDNKDILANFAATPAFPSGMANQLFNCAVAAACTVCK